jgi:hypothetical protein
LNVRSPHLVDLGAWSTQVAPQLPTSESQHRAARSVHRARSS